MEIQVPVCSDPLRISNRVLPHPFAALPHAAPLPTFLIRTGVPGVPVVLPHAGAAPTPLVPTLDSAPALPRDHVTPVLRGGAPAILLLPQTPTSGVYHLSDQQHRFPPFLEGVVNRVQNLFSSYVQVDPFHTPLGGPQPPKPLAAATAAPADNTSTAAITTTTTTTTTARTHGQGINLRLLAPLTAPGATGHAPGSPGHAPGTVPRDVELLDGRSGRFSQQHDVVGGGLGQPIAFASATAQVHQQPFEADSYLPVNNNNSKDPGNTVEERPPAPPASRPGPRPGEDRRYGARGPTAGPPSGPPSGLPSGPPRRPSPTDASYYRRP